MRLPAAKQKVESQLREAEQKIEDKLVPKGPHVVRHLALPIEGKIPELIFAEMDDMDAEMGVRADWEGGKLSGAVYRKSTCFNISTCILTITH